MAEGISRPNKNGEDDTEKSPTTARREEEGNRHYFSIHQSQTEARWLAKDKGEMGTLPAGAAPVRKSDFSQD